MNGRPHRVPGERWGTVNDQVPSLRSGLPGCTHTHTQTKRIPIWVYFHFIFFISPIFMIFFSALSPSPILSILLRLEYHFIVEAMASCDDERRQQRRRCRCGCSACVHSSEGSNYIIFLFLHITFCRRICWWWWWAEEWLCNRTNNQFMDISSSRLPSSDANIYIHTLNRTTILGT